MLSRQICVLTVCLPLIVASGCSEPAPPETQNEQVKNRGEGKDNWWDSLPREAWSHLRKVTESQGWFEVYEVFPGVMAIYEPGQFEEVISYLIIGSERALLFDSGLGIGDMRQVVSELTEMEPVVLNSHTHYDHVGGNHGFQHVYATGLEYTTNNARGRPHEAVAEFVGEGWIWKPTPEGFSRESYVSKPFTIEKTIGDGDRIELGDRTLEILLTPGHAPDSLCILDRENGLLFTGDTFYPASLYAHLPGSDFDQYMATAKRLAGLADVVEHVLPAHNEPLMESGDLLALAEAFEAVRSGDGDYVVTDGNREYDFGRFSIIVGDPPPWEQ